MMKIRNLFGIVLLVLTAVITSCNDNETKQIYLFDTENGNRITDGNDLHLYCFRQHNYIVRGGSGKYEIAHLEGGNIEAKWGNRDTLRLTPNLPIRARITLTDYIGNTSSMGIDVTYLNRRYEVDSLFSEVKGDRLEVGQMKELHKKITEAANIQPRSTFIFIYDNMDNIHKGQLRITDSHSQLVGGIMDFTEDKELKTEDGTITTYQPIHVYSQGTLVHEYKLIRTFAADQTPLQVIIKEDVRHLFKNLPYYSKIDEANICYKVSQLNEKD